LADKAKQKELIRHAPSTNNAGTEDFVSRGTAVTTYVNENYGFSFEYPAFFKAGVEDFTYLPYGNKQAKTEVNFYHEIAMEHCALSGECQPKTLNMNVGAAIVRTSLQDIENQAQQEFDISKKGEINTYTICQGAEGEGICYAFIPVNSNTTLLIYNSYMDESILSNYQQVAGFIKYAEQQRIMDDIYKSIKFINQN
jgi:hypothetical protein